MSSVHTFSMTLSAASFITHHLVLLWITSISLIKMQRLTPVCYLASSTQLPLVLWKLFPAAGTFHQQCHFQLSFHLQFNILRSWQHRLQMLDHIQLWIFYWTGLSWQGTQLLFLLVAYICCYLLNSFLPHQCHLLTFSLSGAAAYHYCQADTKDGPQARWNASGHWFNAVCDGRWPLLQPVAPLRNFRPARHIGSLNISKISSMDVTVLCKEYRLERQDTCSSSDMIEVFHDCPPVLSCLNKYNRMPCRGTSVANLPTQYLLSLQRYITYFWTELQSRKTQQLICFSS